MPSSRETTPEVARRSRRLRRWDDNRHRLTRLVAVPLITVVLFALREAFFPEGKIPQHWWERSLVMASWLWVGAVPAAAAGLAALLVPQGRRPEDSGGAVAQLVAFRIVSRGTNASALADTVAAIRQAMTQRALFDYRIEVVTDQAVELPEGPDLEAHVVPPAYETPNGSKYKARALHYLSDTSDLPLDAWVFHCDEESHVTPGLIGGIRDAIVEEEERAAQGLTPRIGQGCILYWRNLRAHPLLTLADSLRTGDDVTRFLAQFRSGALMCGMHGSFILVRADIERTVTFDVGPEGSVTEDAWWAYSQAEQGREFRWVDGYLIEQSPEHSLDFVKQRRRWYSGLWKVCLYAPAPFVARAVLMGFLSGWLLSALGGIYTVINLFTGYYTPLIPRVLGAVVMAWYVNCYLTGLWLNLRGMPADVRPGRGMRLLLTVGQVLLLPVFGILEGLGVLYALVKPERGFHVVKKRGSAGEGSADAGLAEATTPPKPAIAA